MPLFAEDGPSIFRDLALVEEINKEINDHLPFLYNFQLQGGYFNMPSARMDQVGMVTFGGGRIPPYNNYGVAFQIFDRIALSGNYRVFTGLTEGNFGKEGFGDDAERIGNIKLGVLMPWDGYPMLPSIAIGADDFIGTKRFNSQYIVTTKEWIPYNLEATLGWGRKRIKGFFGGIAWSPFRQTGLTFLKDLTFSAEYDANNYKRHPSEHPRGREVKSRVNGGITYLAGETLQLSVSSVRGTDVAGFASIRFPLGSTQGLVPKIDDPLNYNSPVDTEPLGVLRHERDFASQMAFAFSEQDLDLYTLYVSYDENMHKVLWMKVINNRYREELTVRERLQHLLAALTPSDIEKVIVVIEADVLPTHSYTFRREDLYRYREGEIGEFEMETLSPMKEAIARPNRYESTLLFRRKKAIWTFTFRPRVLTFFGSAKGKIKYNLGLLGIQDGYLFDQLYYKVQAAYEIKSSMANLGATDRINPSQIVQVRTDSLKYFQSNTVSLEKAFLQKSFNFSKGMFGRLATGYFEPAYGGVAAELLYYPVSSSWAVGIEGAVLLKRRYKGIAFTHKIRKLDGHKLHHPHYLGVQGFFNVYYDFKPLHMDFKVMAGRFLAKDVGARLEVGRYFASGMRFSLWYTWTNGHDKVNGSTYHDKGFSFLLPLDIFLPKSSRNYVGYAMSAWLRDVGAISETGKTLYWTLSEERWRTD